MDICDHIRLHMSGVGGFEGSGGVRACSSSAAVCPPPLSPLHEKNYRRIFTFCMYPTGQSRGVRTPGPPGHLRRWRVCGRWTHLSTRLEFLKVVPVIIANHLVYHVMAPSGDWKYELTWSDKSGMGATIVTVSCLGLLRTPLLGLLLFYIFVVVK